MTGPDSSANTDHSRADREIERILSLSEVEFKSGSYDSIFATDDPAALIASLSELQALAVLYNTSAGLPEPYTIGQHTEHHLGQFEKYYAREFEKHGRDLVFSVEDFRKHIALHDIAKTLPLDQNYDLSKRAQHDRALRVIAAIADSIDFSGKIFLSRELIDGDPIGDLLRAGVSVRPALTEKQALWKAISASAAPASVYKATIESWLLQANQSLLDPEQRAKVVQQTAKLIKEKADRSELTPEQYLRHQMIYFTCDASSYTADAWTPGCSALPSIDHLFEIRFENFSMDGPTRLLTFDSERGRIKFSTPFETLVQELEQAVRSK